ncbi:TetR/AcrR family transcriptional regulator [Vogesella facilis]|uniref:TetR/AcrR family transcriptional regulator n=1 Tax=Vogesella facilis TaxID=1655232 RepID=A0ABV7RH70_9NEIS
MSRQTPDHRQRLVAAAADMLGRRGLNATSVRELAKYANAPLGSTYHYFPGGKPQVVTEAVQFVGSSIYQIIKRELASGPLPGLRAFLALWRDKLENSAFAAGCPLLAVAAEEAEDGARPLAAAAEAFTSWQRLLSETLSAHGVAAAQAGSLATLIVAAVEGAIVLCRAQRCAEPLLQVGAQLEVLLQASLPAPPAG